MFDIFKKGENNQPMDVKAIRDAVLRGVKQELQKSEGGEGRNIKSICLFIACPDVEKHVYESAVYLDAPEKLQKEIQKIADDFALNIPENWTLEVDFPTELPPEARQIKGTCAGIFIRTKENSIQKSATGYVHVLAGAAEKKVYQFSSIDGKINIGRDKSTQVSDGFFRHNHIAFPAEKDEVNKYISRQHAHIEWSNDSGAFMFFADEGGVPPGNKVKIRSAASETLNKLMSTQIGHRLEEGDQVILGESAVILFSYKG
jgi:hypothetical protein